MKCRLPVAEVDGVTVAVLPCQEDSGLLGLLLHPAPNEYIQGPSSQLYYVSWSFSKSTGSEYGGKRLACLGSDAHNLQFRGKPVDVTWHTIYIAAHPPTAGRRDGAHLLQEFIPDVAPMTFRIPRTLLQTLGALEFSPITRTVSWDPASKDTMWFGCQCTALLEYVGILLGSCMKASTNARPCHWAWAEYKHRATWTQPDLEYVHDCTTDHIEDWPDRTREFGDAERTIRLVFVPCTHEPQWTLVLGLELVGSVYERIQKSANIHLRRPPVRSSHVRANGDARTDPNISVRTSIPPSAPSFLHRFSSVLKNSATNYKIGRLKTARHSRKISAVHTRNKGLHAVSTLSDVNPASSSKTRNDAVCDVSDINDLVDIPRNLHDVIQKLMEHSDGHNRQIHEMEETHTSQICKLRETIESQRAEVVQLKETLNAQNALLAQVLHNNGIITPEARLPPA